MWHSPRQKATKPYCSPHCRRFSSINKIHKTKPSGICSLIHRKKCTAKLLKLCTVISDCSSTALHYISRELMISWSLSASRAAICPPYKKKKFYKLETLCVLSANKFLLHWEKQIFQRWMRQNSPKNSLFGTLASSHKSNVKILTKF